MQKTIYSGAAEGLFSPTTFLEYIEQWRGAERITSFTDELPIQDIYHISPQEVTLVYDSDDEKTAEVTAYGRSKSIGEVEQKILREATKYSPKK